MANMLLSNVTAHLPQLFDTRVRNQINRSAPFFSRLRKKSYAGKAIDWRVSESGRTAAAFASGADAPTADFDVRHTPTLSWARYHTTIGVAFDALIIALQAPNPSEAITDLFAEEVDSAARVLGKTINAALFAGDGTSNAIAGIAIGIDDAETGNDYAGIDVSAETWWKAASLGTAGSELAMTYAAWGDFHKAIFDQFGQPLNGAMGDYFLTSSALYNKYEALIGTAPRQVINADGTVLRGGSTGLEYDGVPIVRDGNCTAERVYGIRNDSILCKYLPVTNVNGMPMQNRAPQQLVSGTVGFDEPTQVMIHFNELGRSGAAVKWQVWVQLQLQVTDRFAHGVWRTDLDGTA